MSHLNFVLWSLRSISVIFFVFALRCTCMFLLWPKLFLCDACMHCSSCCFFCHISLISLFHVCVHSSERHPIISHSSHCLQFVNGEFHIIVCWLAHAQPIFIVKYIYSNLTEFCVFTKLCKAAVRFWKLHVQRIRTANPVMWNVCYVEFDASKCWFRRRKLDVESIVAFSICWSKFSAQVLVQHTNY